MEWRGVDDDTFDHCYSDESMKVVTVIHQFIWTGFQTF